MKRNKKHLIILTLLFVLGIVLLLIIDGNENSTDGVEMNTGNAIMTEQTEAEDGANNGNTITAEEIEAGANGGASITSDQKETEAGVNDMDSIAADKIQNGEESVSLDYGLNIVSIGRYMGAYVEDGTDEYVDNVMMICVENTGEKEIQFANITLNKTFLFELTTLLPGECMMVLEKNRAPYDENLIIQTTDITNAAFFQSAPSMHEELLTIEGKNNIIYVSNISGKEFAGGKVFYKNMVNDMLLGGITYSASIPALGPGESVSIQTKHFKEESSRFRFVTYEE